MNKIDLRQGDCLEQMRTLSDNTVDAVITDPPYGYSFMGKSWDKAVPSVEIWQECLRALKPGGWCMVMSAPRSDVQNAMISRLMDAGFRLDFTPIYWTYASGFPKAGNVGKLVDKRLGATREVLGTRKSEGGRSGGNNEFGTTLASIPKEVDITAPATPQAKALDGSYTGFQPKPAVEVIIVAMKPLSEKTYVDQALKNRKGITWLDDARIPTGDNMARANGGTDALSLGGTVGAGDNEAQRRKAEGLPPLGRFPANLLVSDEALNGHSKYFDLDAWANTLPFLAVPKASKSEKNKGVEHLEGNMHKTGARTYDDICANCKKKLFGDKPFRCECEVKVTEKRITKGNFHPTVKPLKLMSYLITLFSRDGDTVLDPFMGSGTTGVACKNTGRNFIGIELDKEYFEIAKKRIEEANQ